MNVFQAFLVDGDRRCTGDPQCPGLGDAGDQEALDGRRSQIPMVPGQVEADFLGDIAQVGCRKGALILKEQIAKLPEISLRMGGQRC